MISSGPQNMQAACRCASIIRTAVVSATDHSEIGPRGVACQSKFPIARAIGPSSQENRAGSDTAAGPRPCSCRSRHVGATRENITETYAGFPSDFNA